MTPNTIKSRLGNSGRGSCVLLIVLLAAALGILLYLSGGPKPVAKDTKPEETAPDINLQITEHPSEGDASWQTFVKSVKDTCAKSNEGVSVDYEALHEHDGQHFGVIVIGWKQSEYEVDLYRYDEKTKGWKESPMVEGDAMSIVDVESTEKKWGVSESIIEGWIKEANSAVQKKYKAGGE